MAIYWMGQVMPLAVTALLPAVLFPLTGILPARDVSKEFLNVSPKFNKRIQIDLGHKFPFSRRVDRSHGSGKMPLA
jgi:di/tricarboxylate transporter